MPINAMSALPPKAAIDRRSRNVGFVPIADIAASPHRPSDGYDGGQVEVLLFVDLAITTLALAFGEPFLK